MNAPQISLSPIALANISKHLQAKKALALSGYNAYVSQQADYFASRALEKIMQDNPEATGLAGMLAEVKAEFDDENGEFAAHREALHISADLLNDLNKPQCAHLAQTLRAVRLERQHDQTRVAA